MILRKDRSYRALLIAPLPKGKKNAERPFYLGAIYFEKNGGKKGFRFHDQDRGKALTPFTASVKLMQKGGQQVVLLDRGTPRDN